MASRGLDGGGLSIGTRARFETCQNRAMRLYQTLASKRNHVLALAAEQGARGVRVFGTVTKGLDNEVSDLDLLADLPRGTSLIRKIGLQLDNEDALGVIDEISSFTEQG